MVKDSGYEKIAAGQSMNRYRFSCACSHGIEVGPGQAGGIVTCPACGAEVTVPRLGAMVRLDAAAEPPSAVRRWSTAEAWWLAGVALALVGLAAAGWLRGRRFGVVPLNEQAVRTTVASAPIEQVYAAWLAFERQGISQEPLPEEDRRQRQAAALGGVEIVAWSVAAAGAAVAAAAAIPAWRARRRRTVADA